jgi:hypothetical protein
MPIETRDEFIERHGGRKALLRMPKNEFLLPSGARLIENSLGTQYIEPPTGTEARLQAKRHYWATLAERTEKDFNALKAAVMGPRNPDEVRTEYRWKEDEHGPLPDHQPTTALNVLRDLVRKYRAAVADIDRQYQALPSVVHRQRAEAARAEQARRIAEDAQRRAAAQRAAVAAITLDD